MKLKNKIKKTFGIILIPILLVGCNNNVKETEIIDYNVKPLEEIMLNLKPYYENNYANVNIYELCESILNVDGIGKEDIIGICEEIETDKYIITPYEDMGFNFSINIYDKINDSSIYINGNQYTDLEWESLIYMECFYQTKDYDIFFSMPYDKNKLPTYYASEVDEKGVSINDYSFNSSEQALKEMIEITKDVEINNIIFNEYCAKGSGTFIKYKKNKKIIKKVVDKQ